MSSQRRARRPRRALSPTSRRITTDALAGWAVPAAVALVTILAFLPSLRGQFLGWDDDLNFVSNPHYRGLGWSELHWMFTTAHAGHYIPVTWITLGLDYLVWGMDPLGYHVTNVLLHAANAVLAYAIALHLLRHAVTAPADERPWRQRACAAAAALFFAVHPLRVESVAWITERRDVLSAFFYLLALLTYLHACETRSGGDGRRESRWYWVSACSFTLAVLSKSMAVTLPGVLLILDLYPLRRLRARDGLAASRRVLIEKLPFVALALIASAVAVTALIGAGLQTPATRLDWPGRIMISLYNPAFYLWKTLVPTGLSPLYELPEPFNPLAPSLVLGASVTAAISWLAIGLRRRLPGILAAWAGFIVMLFPVIGIVHNGYQIAADRYTYLPSLSWSLLAGAALLSAWRAAARPAAALGAPAVAALAVIVLAGLTWHQSDFWRDSDTLWSHALAAAPSAIAEMNLGVTRDQQGRFTESAEHLRRALWLRPGHPEAHFNLGVTFQHQGRLDEAADEYRRALELKPGYADARINLGAIFLRREKLPEAEEQFVKVLKTDPRSAVAHNNLGLVAAREGRTGEAIRHYDAALASRPDYPEALYNLGNALLAEKRTEDSAAALTRAVQLSPRFAEAHNSLGVALAQLGRLVEARAHFRQAVLIDPAYAEARENLRLAMLQQGFAPAGR